jgi:hypothetical protein
MQQVYPDEVRPSVRIASMAIAAIFLLATMLAGYRYIGLPPVIIVGGSGTAAFVLWSPRMIDRRVLGHAPRFRHWHLRCSIE